MGPEGPVAFIDYWNAVDAALLALCCIDTRDAGISAEELALTQEDGWTPEEFVRWFAEKYDLKIRG